MENSEFSTFPLPAPIPVATFHLVVKSSHTKITFPVTLRPFIRPSLLENTMCE